MPNFIQATSKNANLKEQMETKKSNETWLEFAKRLTINDIKEMSNKHIKAIELMVEIETLEKYYT